MATFKKIPTGNPDLDRVQQNIEALAGSIPAPTVPNVVTVSSDYTVTGAEDVLHVNAQAGPVKITLPAPSASNRPIQIKQVNLQTSTSKVNQVTLSSSDGSKTIAGKSLYKLDTTGTGSVSITADDTQHYPCATAGGNPAVSPTTTTNNTIINPVAGVTSVGGINPILSTGGTTPTILIDPVYLNPPITSAVQYVHPLGDNNAPGTENQPKKTGSYAYAKALTAGGSIYYATGSQWSDGTEGLGLTAGQGCHLTGWEDLSAPVPSGWLKLKAHTFDAWGTDTSEQYSDAMAQLTWGGTGSNPRLDPGYWVVAASAAPFALKNLDIVSSCPLRKGWEYRRNADTSIAWGAITSASRTIVGQSTFTVGFPAAWPVVSLKRTSNVTTVVYTQANIPSFTAIGPLSLFHLATTLPDFTTGDYTVIDVFQTGSGQFTARFADPGSDTGLETTGTNLITTSAVSVGDIIEVESTDPQFVQSMYRVIGVPDTTHIVVSDPASTYGSRTTPYTASNIGRYVLQDRQQQWGIAFDRTEHCAFTAPGFTNPENFHVLPAIDIGSSSAGAWSWYEGGSCFGGQINANVDPDRTAGVFMSGGSRSGGGFQMRDTRIGQGNIRIDCRTAPNIFGLKFITSDSGNGFARPTVEVVNSTGTILNCDTIQNADGGNAEIDLGNCSGLAVTIIGTPRIINASPASSVIVLNEPRAWERETLGFEATGKYGWYADGKLVGRRIDAQSQFNTFENSGYTNVMQDPGSWSIFTGTPTITPNQNTDGLDGLGKGWLLGGGGQLQSTNTIPSSQVGDRYVIGFWAKAPVGTILNGATSILYLTSVDNSNVEGQKGVDFGGDGEWQYFADVGTVSRAGHTSFFIHWFTLGGGVTWTIYKPWMIYFPAGTTSVNEAYRIANTYRPPPPYLQKGTAGTDTGQTFIAHGGLGVDSSVLISPSGGAASLVKWEPRYAADGTTIQGYEPVYSTAGTLPTGSVTNVSATSPLFSSGGTTPNITIQGAYVSGSSSTTPQNLGSLTTGLLKGTVSGSINTLSTAAAGTDYQAPMTAGPGITIVGSTQIRLGSVGSPVAPTIADFGGAPPSAASAASMQAVYQWDLINIVLTGSTHVTGNGLGLMNLQAPAITDSSAVTVDFASTLSISGAPTQAGSVTLTHPIALWVQSGVTQLDGWVAINTAVTSVPTNTSLIVTADNVNDRDRIQLFVGGGTLGATGTGDNTFVDILPSGSPINAGVSAGIYATERIRSLTYTGASAPTITEATTLYIDGAPTLSGASGQTWAMHVKSGNVLIEDQLLVLAGGLGLVVNPTAGVYSQADFGLVTGLSNPASTGPFIWIPTTSGGTPTGTPAGLGFRSGATAMVYDPTGDILYVWNSGSASWKAH